MGGFPALGIGVSIGGDRILASAPEYILNTPNSLSIRHLKDTQIECGDLTSTLSSNSKSSVTVLVGKQKPFDMNAARRLSEFSQTDVVALETGHNTFPYLKDVGRLGATLEAFVDARTFGPLLPEYKGQADSVAHQSLGRKSRHHFWGTPDAPSLDWFIVRGIKSGSLFADADLRFRTMC
jgi:hypothetical protein